MRGELRDARALHCDDPLFGPSGVKYRRDGNGHTLFWFSVDEETSFQIDANYQGSDQRITVPNFRLSADNPD